MIPEAPLEATAAFMPGEPPSFPDGGRIHEDGRPPGSQSFRGVAIQEASEGECLRPGG